MSSSSGDEKKITLKSSDGKTMEVEETVAMESQTIKQMVDDNRKCAGGTVIELPKVTSVILLKVFEYCKKHVEARGEKKDDKLSENELRTWDREFMKVDQQTLFDLVLAAHYLHIINLVDLTCQTVADMLRGKTAEEIRKAFNIPENFTPEEEERIRRENPWAF